MKKFLGIILLVALALVTFGCKPEADLGADAKNWNNLQSIGGNSKNLLRIEAKEYDIDWWVITDEKGIVIEDYDIEVLKSKDDAQTEIKQSEKILKDTTIELKFKFEKNTKVVLWIAQDERVPKNTKADGTQYEAGSKDYRGRIPVGPNQGYIAVDKDYREEMSPIGVIDITCNETGSDGDNNKYETIDGKIEGNWSGNYRITEVWPLTQKENSPEWEATEGLKFILDAENYIEEGSSKKFIFPAGKQTVLALKQPDRFVEGKDNAAKMEQQKDWYWCLPLCEKGKIEIKDDTSVTTSGDIEYQILEPHKTISVTSQSCKFFFKLGTFYKSAMGAEYVVDEFYASSEK